MAQNQLELASIFQTVTQTLAQNQQALNQADEYNQDHGDNMVRTFQTITSALNEKQGKPASTALSYAARKLARTTSSKSGQLYAQGLSRAATQFKGKQVDERGAMQLLQTLIGGGQASQGDILGTVLGGMAGGQSAPSQSGAQDSGGDMLGALLGGMAGGQQTQSGSQDAGGDLLGALLGGMAGDQQTQAGAQGAGGDLLGALLGGMAGGQSAPSQSGAQDSGGDMLGALLGGLAGGQSSGGGLQDGLDAGDLLQAGMAFFQAKQSGGSTMQALLQAFMAVSGMGKSADRTASTQLVVSSFLQALGASGR